MLVLYICTMINAPAGHREIWWALEVALSKFSKRSWMKLQNYLQQYFHIVA